MKKQSWLVAHIAGSEVSDERIGRLGVLCDVLPTGSNDVFVVKETPESTHELLIPVLRDVIISVDEEQKKIVVRLPAGLKEIYDEVAAAVPKAEKRKRWLARHQRPRTHED